MSDMYAFRNHRKMELIKEVCAQKGLAKREANVMTLKQMADLLGQPYIALNQLPKPSHRRPLPVRKWLVPKENKVFILMSKPFAAQYEKWESQFEQSYEEDPEEFYEKIAESYDQCQKCPKMKWIHSFARAHPQSQMIAFISPLKWKTMEPCLKWSDLSYGVLHHPNTRSGKKTLQLFREGAMRLLVVAMSDPPYDDLPDCTWIHTEHHDGHRRCASEHFYLYLIKPQEQESTRSCRPSLDMFRLSNQEDELESV